MTKKHLFILAFITGNILANVQFYAPFGSDDFKQKCINSLEKINFNIPVYCSISGYKRNLTPIVHIANETHISISFRKDVLRSLNEEELRFFILSTCISLQKTKQKGWKLYPEIGAIMGMPIAISSLASTAATYTLFDPQNCTINNIFKSSIGLFCGTMFGPVAGSIASGQMAAQELKEDKNQKTFGQTMLYNVLAPLIGTAIGLCASIPLMTKYIAYLSSIGDAQAAEFVGYSVALTALKKTLKLPRKYDGRFDGYCLSRIHNYEARYKNLLNNQK